MKKIYKVVVLWGTNGFWKWLVDYIQKEFWEYVSLDVIGSKGNRIAAVKNADIVIYSVPISVTQKVIEETLSHLKPWTVVADVTSIKKFPSAAMQMRDDIIVIPTHPMFGPYISTIAGQVVVLTPEESIKETWAYKFLYNFLKSKKAKVIESTPEYHDKMMAIVQWLTHLNMFVVGETIKRLGFNITNSMDFISPIYKLMVSSVGRYLWQNPWLYADIQMYNDEVLCVHEAFLDTAQNFHDSVKSKDYDRFCTDIVSAREFFGEENCMAWQEYTDKVIYMLGAQIDILKNNIWKNISLKNIYSWEMYVGELTEYKDGKIFLSDGKIYKIDQYEIIKI